MNNARNRKIIVGSFIVVLIVAFVTIAVINNSGSAPVFGGGGGYPVKVVEIGKGDISSSISANGVMEEVEKAEVYMDTPLKVNRVLVVKGQKIIKGQKLLEMDVDDLTSQLETLKINRNTQEISANSKAPDIQVETALNTLKTAEKTYNDNKKAYENNKALYKENAISKSELDMSEKAFIESDTGMGGLQNAQLSYRNAVENAKTGKQTAQDNLKVTDMQIADLEKKMARIDECTISPMDGVVAVLNVTDGSLTSSMQPVYKVINPDKLQVKANVKEFDVKNVAVGQLVRITGDAIDKNTAVNGKVAGISPVATVNRTTSGDETVVEVTIAVDGGGILKPGFNVTCDIFTVDKKNALIVPMEAITPDKDDNTLVFAVDTKTNTLVEKNVTIGIYSDMNVEVVEGLKEGDLVVTDPKPTFKEGLKVRIQDDSKK